MLRATKVRIYPTPEQVDFLNQQFGAVRFAYNKALRIISTQYRRHGVSLKARKDIKPLLAIAKKSRKYHWLNQYDSISLQQAVINLGKAFDNFFDKKKGFGYPKFKRKHGEQKSYHCTSVSVTDNYIKIPKIKTPIPANIHREIGGKVKSITISRTVTGKYYASILVDDGQEAPKTTKTVSRITGIDLGLSHFAISSEGHKEANPRFLKRAERNLRRKQRQLSRKQKGSKNRAKARLLVAKCHEKVANARADFQHKYSRQLIDENQAIVVETLKSANMMKNRKLSKHIADASWHSFVEKLKYKAEQAGVHLVKIDQWYASSKACNCCGHKMDDMPLSLRKWDCPNCGSKDIDRDLNAALNILEQGILKLKAAGLVVSACGGQRNSRHERVAA